MEHLRQAMVNVSVVLLELFQKLRVRFNDSGVRESANSNVLQQQQQVNFCTFHLTVISPLIQGIDNSKNRPGIFNGKTRLLLLPLYSNEKNYLNQFKENPTCFSRKFYFPDFFSF